MIAAEDSANRPLHVRAATSPSYSFREHAFRFLVTGEKSGGSYSLMEIISPQGSGPAPHVHAAAEEHFVVLDGEVDFQVRDECFTATKGDLVHVPRGCVHGFTVRSGQAVTLATYTPAGEELAFIAAGVLVEG
jgi:quercetin dioxygenase-like cupin family protein